MNCCGDPKLFGYQACATVSEQTLIGLIPVKLISAIFWFSASWLLTFWLNKLSRSIAQPSTEEQ